jgi:hypothetical protein
MSKKIKAITLLGGSAGGAALLLAPTAGADPSSSASLAKGVLRQGCS